MAVSAGTRLGPYEVLAQIGVGGMGEVYRANDTNLKRAVAIKVLPAAVAADVERLGRFQREAEVLASLNHPNIAQIYGLEKSAGVTALVMELVEGPTLDEWIRRPEGLRLPGEGSGRPSGLPIEEALAIARQIAEALEAAHGQGVIHRDLKPANIKVRPDGTVKVLDFGLAKAMEAPDASSSSLSQSPTVTTPVMMTSVGVILGTAAYMSPEQARGKAVDTRADIWAFGCVLYEMLTGRRAFDGETVPDILGSILKTEPDWNALPASTPWPLASLLRHCMQKDSSRRMQAIGDARFAIEEIRTMPAAVPLVPKAPQRWTRVFLAGALLASVAVLAIAVPRWRQSQQPLNETRFSIALPQAQLDLAVSPDGRAVIFADLSGLSIRRLDSLDTVKLPGTESGTRPFWSPDSRSIGYVASGRLLRTEVGGGAPQVLSTQGNNESIGTWSSDGVILFTTGNVIRRISALGGDSVQVTELDKSRQEMFHRHPFFLPDRRHFVYFAQSAVPSNSSIRVGSLDSNENRELIKAVSRPAYVSAGWLLYQRAGTLFAQTFDADRLELTGQPVRVADNVANNANGSAAFSVSDTGVLMYRSGAAQAKSELTWFERNGVRIGQTGSPATYTNLELSPDEARLAVDLADDQSGARDIWVVDLARSVTTRLTFNPGIHQRPVWFPDGNRIAFQAGNDLYAKSSNGTGNQELLLDMPESGATVPYSFTPDGRFLLFARAPIPGAVSNLWLLPLVGDRKPSVVIKNPYWDTPGLTVAANSGENHGQFSPDGKWLVYAGNASGKYEIYVESYPPGAGKWQISTMGGMQPRWRRDGKEIFYVAADGKLMAAAVTAAGTTLQAQTPVVLFQTQLTATALVAGTSRQYDVSADGQRFLVNTPLSASSSVPITVILNWTAALKR